MRTFLYECKVGAENVKNHLTKMFKAIKTGVEKDQFRLRSYQESLEMFINQQINAEKVKPKKRNN